LRWKVRSPDPHTPAQPYADRAAKWSDVNTRVSIPKLSDLSFKPSNTTARTSIVLKKTTLMATAAKKKLVVCGGNGFLGTFPPF
jgi:hypothetical protein